MKRLRFPLYSIAAITIGISTSTGQTNGPAVQNASRPAVGKSVRPGTVRPNTPNVPYVPRGPANVGQRGAAALPPQMQRRSPANFQPNYSSVARQANPRLTATTVRPNVSADNAELTSNVLPRNGIVRPPLSVVDAQRTLSTDNPKPTSDLLAKAKISEGLERIETPGVERNGNMQSTVRDPANRESKQHKAKRNHQKEKNRFSYSDALRRNWHEWHHRDWWKQHCNTIVFVTGGYYFLDAGYWYPAWGYDPSNSYHDYDGPIYTYGNLLPDQVIANVQAALQDAGYYFGAVTGSLSVETRAALVNFQRDQGLIVTGAIDESTVEALGLY
jgi:hypothetical protein